MNKKQRDISIDQISKVGKVSQDTFGSPMGIRFEGGRPSLRY